MKSYIPHVKAIKFGCTKHLKAPTMHHIIYTLLLHHTSKGNKKKRIKRMVPYVHPHINRVYETCFET